jgi:hypothetical protein
MEKTKKISVVLWLLAMWVVFSSFDVSENETEIDGLALFKIARSRDANEIWYALNFNQNGNLNQENPIRAFWVKRTENNKTEPLTRIQNRYAYGIKVVDSGSQKTKEWEFQFVSYAKQTFTLRQTDKDHFKVYTQYNNKEIEVTRIFVEIEGGSFWVPSVPYVMLTGVDPHTGREITETIIP